MDGTCPFCHHYGCSPTCTPPPSQPCSGCGSNAHVIGGVLTCDSCGAGHHPSSPFDTDPESASNRRFTQ